MKRFIVSLTATVMLLSIGGPAFAFILQETVVPTNAEATLLNKGMSVLRPEKFKGIVNIMDTAKNILFLKKRGKKERILITPKTAVISFAKDSVGLISADELNTGDPVYGFMMRVPKLEVESGEEIFYMGLVIIKVDWEEEELDALRADPKIFMDAGTITPEPNPPAEIIPSTRAIVPTNVEIPTGQ